MYDRYQLLESVKPLSQDRIVAVCANGQSRSKFLSIAIQDKYGVKNVQVDNKSLLMANSSQKNIVEFAELVSLIYVVSEAKGHLLNQIERLFQKYDDIQFVDRNSNNWLTKRVVTVFVPELLHQQAHLARRGTIDQAKVVQAYSELI